MRIRGEARGKFILIIIMMTTFLFCVVPTAAHVVPGHVVISEVCVHGVGSAVDEFVELYNPTDSEISLSGWKLQYKPATDGTWRSKVGDSLPADKKIESHKFLLLAGKLYAGDTMPDYRHDANWSLSNDAGHVRIINAEGKEIDRVGYGTSADSAEGSPAPKPPEGESIERKYLVYGYAPCQDTNNNSEDFDIKTPTPKNSSFSIDPLPPLPDHVVISEVQIDGAGEWVELYNPTSGSIDLSSMPIYLCYYASGKNWNKSSNPAADKMQLSGTIPTHGFYLVRIDGTVSDPDYDWGYSAPASTLSNTAGSVGIFPWNPTTKTAEEAKSGRIDAVGWGSVEHVNETQSAAVPGAGKSIERKSLYEGYAPCQGTNNNSEDFFVQDTPTPKNSSYSMSPTPAPNPGPPVAVPEFNATGLLALIGITSIVLAVTILASNRKRGI